MPSAFCTAVEIFLPPETHLARPRAKTIMASVAMNGWIRNRATSRPDTPPQAAPIASASGDRQPRGPAPVDRHQRERDRHQRQHAAHRQVDAAGDDHQRHAAGQDAEDRDLPEHVAVRAQLEERAVGVEDQPKTSTSSRATSARPAGLPRLAGDRA